MEMRMAMMAAAIGDRSATEVASTVAVGLPMTHIISSSVLVRDKAELSWPGRWRST